MAISSEEKCGICRFACKSDVYKAFCKFYPKNEHLGKMVKEVEAGSLRRTCIICKKSLNYRKVHWKLEFDGWYPMCKEDAQRAVWIANEYRFMHDSEPSWRRKVYGCGK